VGPAAGSAWWQVRVVHKSRVHDWLGLVSQNLDLVPQSCGARVGVWGGATRTKAQDDNKSHTNTTEGSVSRTREEKRTQQPPREPIIHIAIDCILASAHHDNQR